jgi:hypothetical protein
MADGRFLLGLEKCDHHHHYVKCDLDLPVSTLSRQFVNHEMAQRKLDNIQHLCVAVTCETMKEVCRSQTAIYECEY